LSLPESLGLKVTYTDLLNIRGEVAQVEGFENRIEYFERMVASNPDNPTGLLALAKEYQKAQRYEDEAAALERYVSVHSDDEGNAYARLGDVLSHLGRKDEARAAYETGIRQAEKYGHSGMAEDLRLAIIQLGERG
jgi:tetratricopeptide (TPR) repeat protein